MGAGFELNFEVNFPLTDLAPAAYNPRRLDAAAFERLKKSIADWGIVKPVILNHDGTLVAGHQRTKALQAIGETHCPAVILQEKVGMADEVRFNLLHNRVEVEASTVFVEPGEINGWTLIDSSTVRVGERKAAPFRSAMAGMVTGHGPWGSIVCDDQGRVVLNSEYAVVCHDLQVPILTYTIDSASAAQLNADLTGEYGVYDWSHIAENVAPVSNQHFAQLSRLRERTGGSTGKKGETIFRSTMWDRHVLPWLTREDRTIDFGAGYADYTRKLQADGFPVFDYEPFRCITGAYSIDVKAVVSMIRKVTRSLKTDGLFDVVVLDSVINSITTREYQDAVLTCCNALMKGDGKFVLGTRTLLGATQGERASRSGNKSGATSDLAFLDDDMVEFRFTKGKWGAQRYHTLETLTALLDRFFEEFEISGEKSGQMYATCRKPRPLGEAAYKAAADIEFNMPYPNGFFHNKHELVVAELVALAVARDEASKESVA